MYFSEVYFILNGPIILITSIIGIVLNIYTIFILRSIGLASRDTKQRKNPVRFSTAQNSPQVMLHPPLFRQKSATLSLEAELIFTRKLPRAFIYLFWLITCDIWLLLFAILNFSVPVIGESFKKITNLLPIW